MEYRWTPLAWNADVPLKLHFSHKTGSRQASIFPIGSYLENWKSFSEQVEAQIGGHLSESLGFTLQSQGTAKMEMEVLGITDHLSRDVGVGTQTRSGTE